MDLYYKSNMETKREAGNELIMKTMYKVLLNYGRWDRTHLFPYNHTILIIFQIKELHDFT